MRYLATTAQQSLIRVLLKKLELNTRNVCLLHRPVFEAARLWSSADLDKPLDGVLSSLTQGQARDLITALQARVQEEDDQ